MDTRGGIMSKIKKIWQENKVLLVLAIILTICLVVFAVVAIFYFYGGSDNVYGNRLDITKEVPLNKTLLKDIETELTKNESVKTTSATLKGKIVYINVDFVENTKMEDAKLVAENIISLFSEDELAVYDINFTICVDRSENSDGFTLMGARNTSGSGLVIWNNYNIDEGSVE